MNIKKITAWTIVTLGIVGANGFCIYAFYHVLGLKVALLWVFILLFCLAFSWATYYTTNNRN